MKGTVEYANEGLHGNVKVGDSKFWNDAMEEIYSEEFINRFADFLKSKGLNVTIK